MKERTLNKKNRKQAEAFKRLSFFDKAVLKSQNGYYDSKLEKLRFLAYLLAPFSAIGLGMLSPYVFFAFLLSIPVICFIDIVTTVSCSMAAESIMLCKSKYTEPRKAHALISEHKNKENVKASIKLCIIRALITNLIIIAVIAAVQYLCFDIYNVSYSIYISIPLAAVVFIALYLVIYLLFSYIRENTQRRKSKTGTI